MRIGLHWQARGCGSHYHLQHHSIAVNGINLVDAIAPAIPGEGLCRAWQLDEAWHCIDEAVTAAETTNERWHEAEIYRIAGDIMLLSPEPDLAKAERYSSELSWSRALNRQNPGNCARP